MSRAGREFRTCVACYRPVKPGSLLCHVRHTYKEWDERYRTLVYGQRPLTARTRAAHYWERYRRRAHSGYGHGSRR